MGVELHLRSLRISARSHVTASGVSSHGRIRIVGTDDGLVVPAERIVGRHLRRQLPLTGEVRRARGD